MNDKNDFGGLWPAVFTPVNSAGAPALDQLEKLVDLLISQGMDGLYLLGSTGQGVLFTEAQRKTVTEVVTKTCAGRVPVMVQVGSMTTDESVRLARHAEQSRADAISSVGPIYYSPSADMALKHYSTIAESTGLPFFPYQLGDNSIPGGILSFIGRLLEIPRVKGMKLTTNQLLDIAMVHNFAGDRLRLFSGSDELFCHASLCGTVGAIGSFYNLWGVACKHVLTEFKGGNFGLARRFMLSFQDVIREVLPNVWTFFRKAMIIRYGIDIGATKHPVGNTHTEWSEDSVIAILERIDSMASPSGVRVDERTISVKAGN